MTGGAQDSGVERTPAQFFFECGYGAAYADAFMENGQKPAFTMSDAAIERAWAIAPECYPDPNEWDRYVARATPAPAGWQSIESAPRDGTHFLATITVCHMNRSRWRETHLIWANDSTGTVDNECHQGWEIDDYEAWMPVPEYGSPTAPAEGGV